MTITLNGEIVQDADQWLYDFFGIPSFSPGNLRQYVKENPEGEDLILEINSGGGSAFAGFEMYSVLRSAGCHTVAHVQSLAASAASTMMVGCDEVLLSPVAQVMIHLPTIGARGNQIALEQAVQSLESITESILNGYQLRCGGKTTRDTLEQFMRCETWIPAQDAVAMGLADGLLYQEDAASLPLSIVNSVGGSIRALASAGSHDRASLLARYEEAVKNGAAPAPGHPVPAGCPEPRCAGDPGSDGTPPSGAAEMPDNTLDTWQAKACLEIEKYRFA